MLANIQLKCLPEERGLYEVVVGKRKFKSFIKHIGYKYTFSYGSTEIPLQNIEHYRVYRSGNCLYLDYSNVHDLVFVCHLPKVNMTLDNGVLYTYENTSVEALSTYLNYRVDVALEGYNYN